jgi:predicted ribosome quality control (RQC) complex YloA/Tae2 family protein
MQKINASNYQLMMDYGNTILSNMGRINHGDSHYNYIDENRNINYFITLDTKLTPSQNAQKYFDKYKRQKESLNLLDNKISSVENELMRLREKLNKAERMDNFKELKTEVKKEISEKDETESKHFRKFILSENFQVWVGKNASSNDLLTFKYSNQNDLWFHIRGFSGSHTVLKKSSKNLEFPKEIIKIAASIAAYYSKARNSGTIPVAYTERKYVKKGKGLKAGSVIMDREKVVFVKPGLPFE